MKTEFLAILDKSIGKVSEDELRGTVGSNKKHSSRIRTQGDGSSVLLSNTEEPVPLCSRLCWLASSMLMQS